MKMPIVEGLQRYINDKNIRFHMPGHKGKDLLLEWKKLIPQIDVTELEGTDNLHDPKTIILESQRLAAKTFGAKKTFYSVNGTTGGILAAISAVTNPGDKVLIQRNCHRSVYNALILNNLRVEYIYPNYNNEKNIVTGVYPNEIEEKLKKNKDIKAVVITNPSYYGICSDIKQIVKIVHRYNKVIIVDEAHGSHLRFNRKLPISAIEAGADISVQSIHKTLPAFTQSSMIHVGTDTIDINKLAKMISIYQTTSPSYILMASLDMVRAYMQKYGENKLNQLIEYIEEGTTLLNTFEGINVFNSAQINKKDVFDFDITKLIINIKGISGEQLEYILRTRYKIRLEMFDHFYGLALCSVFDEKDDIDRLVYAVKDIVKNKDEKLIYRSITEGNSTQDIKYIKPQIKLPLYNAFYNKKKSIEISKSLGQISGGFIIPYPPGVPILCPGELITKEIIEYIQFLIHNRITLLGLIDEEKKELEVAII